MLLSFSVFKDKIQDGTKRHTIREYNEKRFKMFCNAKKYQLYWHNPRNGGTLIKEVEPDGKPTRIRFYESYCSHDNQPEQVHIGVVEIESEYTSIHMDADRLAENDGFNNKFEMFKWFSDAYKTRLFEMEFMIIRWKNESV